MKLAILGCGKMTGAMLARWLEIGALTPAQVRAVTRSEQSAERVAGTFGVAADTDAEAAIAWADIVLLGIKPQQARACLSAWRAQVPPGQVWLSVLAGVPLASLAEWSGATVVRLMPNTPVRLGLGATAVVWPEGVAATREAQITALLEALGEVVPLAEAEIDGFTAVAGSGPAYVFLFLEALAAAAEAQGMSAETGRRLALGVLRGAGELAARDPRPPEALRADVTSPGGMTQAAVARFEAAQWPQIVTEAVDAAVARAAELAAG